jgi:nicotinate-nucleotide adenylyltransferase
MKIGILGGTFNPVHNAHLLIAEIAAGKLKLDTVLFIPSASPPHKKPDRLADAKHRLRMLELAISGNPKFQASDIELKRGGKSYSVDTLSALQSQHPDADFYFIIGSDSYRELHLWREIDRLAELCAFAVLVRPGFRPENPHLKGKKITAHMIEGRVSDISSSEIRHRIARGQSIRGLVPDAVLDYIEAQKLYR